MKGLYFRQQRILRPLLILIFQGEADGDGFGSKFHLENVIFFERASFSTPDDFKTIFGMIFQDEADGDGFGS